jgi:hypothetical protein
MSNMIRKLILCLTILAFVAPALAYHIDDASAGKELYLKNGGIICRGADTGGGTVPDQCVNFENILVPRLVDPVSLQKMTKVPEVYVFVSNKMPANNPRSLKMDEYRDIVSFLLQANGIKPDGIRITPDWALRPPGLDIQSN